VFGYYSTKSLIESEFEKAVVRVVVYDLQCNAKIEVVVKKDEYIVGRYNISNTKAKHVKD
jgi:hypothetical protein